MSDDSFDYNDEDPKPSGSRKMPSRGNNAKRKRRIVMRIEFDDSDESSEATENDDEDFVEDDEKPSCSNAIITRRRGRGRSTRQNQDSDQDFNESLQKNINLSRRLRNNRKNPMKLDNDDSSSNSEIENRPKTRGKSGKNYIVSDNEEDEKNTVASPRNNGRDNNVEENGFSSDSSSNELLEKCPICLLTFRQQEIGSPITCDHIFCAGCIEAWSKNVQTCPIDRKEFTKITVKRSYHDRIFVREIDVDPNKASKELQFNEEDDLFEEEVTNCEVCNSPEREDVMLLCDACNQGYHIYCLTPPLDEIPEGAWYCDNCFESSNDEEYDMDEELDILYRDIREMGIPENEVRVTEVHQPHILRTRQNERIRAAILRRTRASTRNNDVTTTRTTSERTSRSGRTTTTTTTTTRTRSSNAGRRTSSQPTRRRRRRRRARQRTYVVEYDLNAFDEKFAVRTTKKVVKRRKRKTKSSRRRRSGRSANTDSNGVRLTASRRLAEQLGVKRDPQHHSHLSGGGAPSLSLFGNVNDLEYFSDIENDNNNDIESEIFIETGHGTAVQTSVRISNVRPQSKKSLLLGRLKGFNNSNSFDNNNRFPSNNSNSADILSSIMDMQDRWHNATRNMENVHINSDGTLNFAEAETKKNTSINMNDSKGPDNNANNDNNIDRPRENIGSSEPTDTKKQNHPTESKKDAEVKISLEGREEPRPTNNAETNPASSSITQAPLYSRGGGNNPTFNSAGTGGTGGYNNRYSNNGSYRGAPSGTSSGGGANASTAGSSSSGQFGRHSTGNITSLSSMQGRGNFSFSDPNYNPNQNQQPFIPFNLRLNQQRNQQNNNNTTNNNNSNNNSLNSIPNHINNQPRSSLPFSSLPPPLGTNFNQQPPNMSGPIPSVNQNSLFGGLPAPVNLAMNPLSAPLFPAMGPPPSSAPVIPNRPPPDTNLLFGGLPAPIQPSPFIPQTPMAPINRPPTLMSVPPPPAPPTIVSPWNNTMFKLSTDYANDDDDDSNCPNFSVYSAESLEVAKASNEGQAAVSEKADSAKEEDENEDLVQLDDDEDIPLPPNSINDVSANAASSAVNSSDLYEPENPTEENDDSKDDINEDDDNENEDDSSLKNNNDSNKKINSKTTSLDDDEEEEHQQPAGKLKTLASRKQEYNPEQETEINSPSNGKDESEEEEEEEDEEEDQAENDHNDKMGKVATKADSSKDPHDSDNSSDEDDENNDLKKSNHLKSNSADTPKSPNPSEGTTNSDKKLAENDLNSKTNRKNVLDLYDDSDWEELDIDKPKALEKPSAQKQNEETTSGGKTPLMENQAQNISASSLNDNDERSLTPLLDEKNDPEEELESLTPERPENAASLASSKQVEKTPPPKETTKSSQADRIEDMETELISEDEEEPDSPTKRRNDKRDKRDSDSAAAAFKKVSHKQKGRNYRGDQPSGNKRNNRKGSLSLSQSRSRSRSRFRKGSRSRSRSRSPGNKRRSRSRSNNKENRFGRGKNRSNNKFKNQRPKRRELPRYDVRNVIGTTKRPAVDRYGRDASKQIRSRSRSISPLKRAQKSFSRSRSGSRSRSLSRSRSGSANRNNRRFSFSLSPSPPPINQRAAFRHQHQFSPGRRFNSPRRRSLSPRRRSMSPRNKKRNNRRRALSRSPFRMRSRSLSPVHRMNGRKVIRRIEPRRTPSFEGRLTPRLSRSRSRSPRAKGNKRKKTGKKKKTKKRSSLSLSPMRNSRSRSPIRRISRQRDPFDSNIMPQRKKRRQISRGKSPVVEQHWSPSPSPPPPNGPQYHRYNNDLNASWTPPIRSPRPTDLVPNNIYNHEIRRSSSKAKDKHKKGKKKKKTDKKNRDGRKDKRRKRRTETPEPQPSKEVFASGNNILVSVSFNKEANQAPTQQNTIVTLPPNREDVLNRRQSSDRTVTTKKTRRDKNHKRRKNDAKPVAIIDLDRSPFQVHQEPADVIVLTDSGEDTHENAREHHRDREQRERDRDRRRSISLNRGDMLDHHRSQVSAGRSTSSLHDKTPPPREHLDTILEESYEMPQTGGPKTPPEPPSTLIKFNLASKKQNKIRNALHDDNDMDSDNELQDRATQESLEHQQHQLQHQLQQLHQQRVTDLDTMPTQKIGPNTPPESGPCSPDAYDPFEPTKSPSMSPRSPTPPPMDVSLNSINDSMDLLPTQKLYDDDHRSEETQRLVSNTGAPVTGNNSIAQPTPLNPVDLVMSYMNTKAGSAQELANKSNDSQFSAGSGGLHDDNLGAGVNSGLRDKPDDNHVKVLSNVLLNPLGSQNQHIPVISSPTPPSLGQQSLKLPKVTTTSTGSSGIVQNVANTNGGPDDSFNLNDFDSPYSPGSADYDDLFDPPPDTAAAKRRSKRSGGVGNIVSGAAEVFDNLFGSSSPIGNIRLPSYTPSKKKNANRKSRKGKDDHNKLFDDVPGSATEMQIKDKFLRKLNRQERVVEEVKLVLKPRFNKKQITKEDYKEIMRRAVPKICHSRSGEINPHKIKNLIEAYVKKFRAKHKKLNIPNTGQVSSAVKCAAYLKKL